MGRPQPWRGIESLKSAKERLDQTDIEILRLLQEDGRITNADLARQVQLSPPSILQRVRKLEETGLIDKYVAILSARQLGYHITVFAQVSLQLHQEQPIEQFRTSILTIPEVMECYHVSGEFDFLLKILVEDMEAYEVLVREKLSTIKGVGKIQSCFVLATAKHSTEVKL